MLASSCQHSSYNPQLSQPHLLQVEVRAQEDSKQPISQEPRRVFHSGIGRLVNLVQVFNLLMRLESLRKL